ncbi:hypothetical protein [Actinoplanes sp. NPDC049316]|uniref:hypothetical protein n=1 Tax=Actinoplanes sp. NPDC049316 TaxID=3154727 RepID=UPI00342DC8D8
MRGSRDAPGRGLRMLLPAGSCVRAIGDYQNGYRAVTANWTGEPACDRLRLDPVPERHDHRRRASRVRPESGRTR